MAHMLLAGVVGIASTGLVARFVQHSLAMIGGRQASEVPFVRGGPVARAPAEVFKEDGT